MGYVEDAVVSSTRAVEFDRAGQLEVASYYYKEAARLLELAYKHAPDTDDKPGWWRKAQEYRGRADSLDKQRLVESSQQAQSVEQQKLQRCRFLLSHALDADEAGDKAAAIQLYTQAVEFSLTAEITLTVATCVEQQKLQRCRFLLSHVLDADEAGDKAAAI